ncbi:hypothetical protein CVT24_004352 [Panaeolus cyanescens]|uniref:Uncharacterized protein n=1 Tax=Panaeolus cyanescens TaxID=181874 RepID=A0A409W7P3_9AGAR|nr:hypothetical protein CVT24_004352 [Panaeolus cyanescens]
MTDPISGNRHFERPSRQLTAEYTCSPRRRLAPLEKPPSQVPLPNPLPENLNRKVAFTPTHTLTVHVAGAAWPRLASAPGQINVPPPSAFKSKEARKQWLEDTAKRMVYEKSEAEKRFPNPKIRATVSQVGLWSPLLRIRRNEHADVGDKKKGITIVTTHAIGFHKEIWEPTFKHLIEITESPSSPIRIQEIWSLEAVNHGDGALINGDYIPKLPDRSDYARDLANFLVHYLPDGADAFTKELPTILPRVSEELSASRVKSGFNDRYVIPIGHSLGADAAGLCALSYPKLFQAIILSEATFYPPSGSKLERKVRVILGTIGRRSSWKSREEARAGFLKAPVFQAFDPSALDTYIQYGLYDNPKTGMVELKCNPALESSEYAELRSMNEGWELIPTLDKNIELRWIMGDKDEAWNIIGGPFAASVLIWKRPDNTSNIRIRDGGHLIIQEKPRLVAEDIALFLGKKFSNGVVPSVIKAATEARAKL